MIFSSEEPSDVQRIGATVPVFAFLSVSMVLMFPLSLFSASDRRVDVFQTSNGELRITPIFHASVMLEFDGKVIYVDPSRGDFSGLPQADLILITHTHGDHLDKAMIDKLKKPSTVFMGTSAVIDTVNCHCKQINVVNERQTKTELGIPVEAVPMYNVAKEGAEPAHHRGIGSGFVLSFGEMRVYFSGDTDCTPEIKTLRNITIAFVLGINSPAETAQCVAAFQPKVFYPYHYGSQDTQQIANALRGTPGIEVRLRKLENPR
jgi:L-ascorbate metabolism protein UlaG (beta-lactamase superfamily)